VKGEALGLIETIGLATAAAALDAAVKTADVKCVAVEKVIGVGKVVSVTVNLTGQVAAVSAAVESGVEAASAVGTVVSSHVLPRPHGDVEKLIGLFGGAKKAKKDVQEEEKAQKSSKLDDSKGKAESDSE
tara:strand:- start:343 stop:732 length:390 start_codon:yes stop_codon:yes gene_type:complete